MEKLKKQPQTNNIKYDHVKLESNAKLIKEMYQKHKRLLGNYKSLVDFQEPIAWLVKRSGDVEFYEAATSGLFHYTHSNGEERNIELIPSMQVKFDYAGKKTRGYILHEDFGYPITELDLAHSAELIKISQEKSMSDLNKLHLKEKALDVKKIWYIVGGIALVIAAIGVAMTLVPSSFWDKVFKVAQQPISNAITTTSQNLTNSSQLVTKVIN